MPKIQQARQPLDKQEERQVRRLASSRHSPFDWVLRARIITRSWDGQRVHAIASYLCCSAQTVRRVLHRFNEEGFEGLGDRPRPGRKARLTEIERRRIIALARHSAPGHQDGHTAPQWSLDALTEAAQAAGIQVQRSQIRRILQRAGVRWRQEAQM
jgi:transposase